jgi:hypothetical protein
MGSQMVEDFPIVPEMLLETGALFGRQGDNTAVLAPWTLGLTHSFHCTGQIRCLLVSPEAGDRGHSPFVDFNGHSWL